MTYTNILAASGAAAAGPAARVLAQRRGLVLGLLMLLAWSTVAAPPSEKFLGKIAVGSQIHVVTNDGQVIEGKVVANSPVSLSVLETGGGEAVSVDRTAVASVKTTAVPSRGNHSWIGKVIAVGAIVTGIAVVAAHGSFL